jgi:hypothetical protein
MPGQIHHPATLTSKVEPVLVVVKINTAWQGLLLYHGLGGYTRQVRSRAPTEVKNKRRSSTSLILREKITFPP